MFSLHPLPLEKFPAIQYVYCLLNICYNFDPSQIEKPLGGIPLEGLTIMELDNEIEQDHSKPTNKSFHRRRAHTIKANRMLLITPTGVRFVLEAADAEERDSWLSQLKITSQLLSSASETVTQGRTT